MRIIIFLFLIGANASAAEFKSVSKAQAIKALRQSKRAVAYQCFPVTLDTKSKTVVTTKQVLSYDLKPKSPKQVQQFAGY